MPDQNTPLLLILNGSLRGAEGNTGWLCAEAARQLEGRAAVEVLAVAEGGFSLEALEAALTRADALLLATGTYWHSWGSPMQRLIEVLTPLENLPALFGKPVGALVTMDSVGGAELSARLLSVFGQLGCLVPPCTSLVLSRLAVAATHNGAQDPHDDDIWQLGDLPVVLDNLLASAEGRPYRPWPARSFVRLRGPFPAAGPLELGAPRFLPPAGAGR
jgi:chromate reductase